MKKNISEMNFAEGEVVLIDKPYGWSSFAVVAQLKKWTKAKIGHAGTLDPLASGLMILCTGPFTKKLTHLTGCDKTYTGIIHIGEITPTYDLESMPIEPKDASHITIEMVQEVVEKFKGNITQFPPIHSAIKQEGTPIYELARKGKEVIVKSRDVLISKFDILKFENNEIHFEIACSSGTYIRSIANDVGKALGVGGYLQSLCRTKIDDYMLENSFSIDEMADYFGSKMNARIILPASQREF